MADESEGALAGTLVVELGTRITAGATVVVIEPSQGSTAGKWKHRAQFVAVHSLPPVNDAAARRSSST